MYGSERDSNIVPDRGHQVKDFFIIYLVFVKISGWSQANDDLRVYVQ